MTTELLSDQEKSVLDVLTRVRGIRPEIAAQYPKLRSSTDAMRKRLERLTEKGYLAVAKLPSGRPIFRLSAKGVRITGAPSAWASSPSTGILAEVLSISATAFKSEYLFLKREEFHALFVELLELKTESLPMRLWSSHFVIHFKSSGPPRLMYWLAEFKPADELESRVNVIAKHLIEIPGFEKLKEAGVLAIAIAVPSEGVKATLSNKSFPLPTEVMVIEELQHLAPL